MAIKTAVQVNGQEVRNPLARVRLITIATALFLAVAAAVAVGAMSSLMGAILSGFGFILAGAVILIVAHVVLRFCGRQGLLVRQGQGLTLRLAGALWRPSWDKHR